MSAEKKQLRKLHLLKKQQFIADKLIVADHPWTRLLGLMGRSHLKDGEGMFFPQCKSVHMWFMRASLDIIFVRSVRDDADLRTSETADEVFEISSVHGDVRPWRPLPISDFSAEHVLELPVGTISAFELRKGDRLCLS